VETGDLGVVEVKIKQIIEEQDAAKRDKDKVKTTQRKVT